MTYDHLLSHFTPPGEITAQHPVPVTWGQQTYATNNERMLILPNDHVAQKYGKTKFNMDKWEKKVFRPSTLRLAVTAAALRSVSSSCYVCFSKVGYLFSTVHTDALASVCEAFGEAAQILSPLEVSGPMFFQVGPAKVVLMPHAFSADNNTISVPLQDNSTAPSPAG